MIWGYHHFSPYVNKTAWKTNRPKVSLFLRGRFRRDFPQNLPQSLQLEGSKNLYFLGVFNNPPKMTPYFEGEIGFLVRNRFLVAVKTKISQVIHLPFGISEMMPGLLWRECKVAHKAMIT